MYDIQCPNFSLFKYKVKSNEVLIPGLVTELGTFENDFINPQVNLQGQLHKPTLSRREASIDATRLNKVITPLVKPSLTPAIRRPVQIRARQSNHFSLLNKNKKLLCACGSKDMFVFEGLNNIKAFP